MSRFATVDDEIPLIPALGYVQPKKFSQSRINDTQSQVQGNKSYLLLNPGGRLPGYVGVLLENDRLGILAKDTRDLSSYGEGTGREKREIGQQFLSLSIRKVVVLP